MGDRRQVTGDKVDKCDRERGSVDTRHHLRILSSNASRLVAATKAISPNFDCADLTKAAMCSKFGCGYVHESSTQLKFFRKAF